jgi:hypothetical protein
MKAVFTGIWLAFVASAIGAPLGIMVPSYFYPSPPTLWNSMSNAATLVPLIAILNPDSGPGASQDANYVGATTNLQAAGGKVIGYVATGYTTTNLLTAEANIDLYFSFYPVNGIFLDEMANDVDTNHVNYYAALYQYIKAKGAALIVVGNPGTTTQEAYLTRPTVDTLMTFEDGTGYPGYVPDTWVTNHLARQFCHVPYNITNAVTMTNYVNLAVSRNAGWIYITDAKGGNPYNKLPSYWTNEVNYVRSLNLGAPATQLTAGGFSNGVPVVELTGATGVYELEATSNFSDWSITATQDITTVPGSFVDAGAINVDWRFYRTVQ